MVFAKTSIKLGGTMSHYKHLTLSERELILYFLVKGFSISKIALKIGRSKSTISRELKRNSEQSMYLPIKAQEKYQLRRGGCKPRKKLENKAIFDYVNDKFLNHQWSPEQISGRLRLEKADFYVSYTTIYRAIYTGMFDTKQQHNSRGNRGAIRKLRHRGKSRHTKNYEEKRGKLQISYLITERPKDADQRVRIGDWEADTILGQTGKEKACLVTLVDRKSRFLIAGKAKSKKAACVGEVMINALKNQPCYSITPDRGKEFALHAQVSDVLEKVRFYFPYPHQPWQRGTNENTNGLLREYFPKGQDFTIMSEEYIQSKVDEMNKRPRKCLGYRTPYEIYYSEVLHLT